MNGNQMALLRQIMEIGFTVVELNLFLDTHPNCEAALRDFREVSARYRQLTEDYQKQYAPLYPYSQYNAEGYWRWTESPWPWEI